VLDVSYYGSLGPYAPRCVALHCGAERCVVFAATSRNMPQYTVLCDDDDNYIVRLHIKDV